MGLCRAHELFAKEVCSFPKPAIRRIGFKCHQTDLGFGVEEVECMRHYDVQGGGLTGNQTIGRKDMEGSETSLLYGWDIVAKQNSKMVVTQVGTTGV